ncbi:MAG: hypothetical protein KatS3mg003_2322 [Candidatus Nitrosocaldaceae archaeon]|nr:MAG: hypothetical protein KatS3mg003_2322 [Candidatus Nitrosocaldaceae archaeon]
MRLIQGSGRGVRNDNDYCITYVLDSSARMLVKRRYKYIPKWFRDAMKLYFYYSMNDELYCKERGKEEM